MKLDLNKKFMTLTGEESKETMGQVLAQQLANANKGDALKLYSWALKLHEGKPIDIDPSDKKILDEFINNTQGLTNMGKAQLLEELDKK